MSLIGGALGMDSNEYSLVTAIDILDLNEVKNPQIPASKNYYDNPSYLRGGDSKSFYKDDLKIIACGFSNFNDEFVTQQNDASSTPFITMFLGE